MILRSLAVVASVVLVACSSALARQEASPAVAPAPEPTVPAALNFKMKDIDGKEINLARYEGKVVLMVNVASKCGYTPQYEGLEQLHQRFSKRGLVILGFPANNFGKQEPGTDEQIKEFCTGKYDVHFQMFSKVSVKGEDICPLYKLLTDPKKTRGSLGEINWNFEKFLLGPDGNVVKHYRSKTTPEMLIDDIVEQLAKLPPQDEKIGSIKSIEGPQVTDVAVREYPGLQNVVAYHEDFISGSAPEGDDGFETLAGMGVRTIISVDGAAPSVEKSRTFGLRYIHLPIGYNGFDEERKLELVRATRDAIANGPVYIHCHHGKHRSAGAAAAIAVSLGWLSPDSAIARMHISGTAPDYKGLFACAANSRVIDSSVIDAVVADFPEASQPQGFVRGMVEIDEIAEHLKAIEKAGWETPADHPDLVPVAEAARMADLFRFLGAGDRATREESDFADHLGKDMALAQGLEDMLAGGRRDSADLSAQFNQITASCKECHAKYRD